MRINTHANRLNTFQLLLVERPDQASGDFDLVVNYDRLDWEETGDADSGVDGLGGLAAEAVDAAVGVSGLPGPAGRS